ncbi:heme exporter protein CcmD [Azospirillum sp. TSO35-2]|uniref:heme exporter protein CcmD n=1 Tax=Azospirillum sp. TSO35-2 TaxID=716796 RepID=UPI000D61A572|nr:heme exporter protein CcmD [Azospirillum sp. TSO35-2]PWC32234.1 cytochrome C biogenesis protein CcmD [Azospirillum sp. TSO35-2]
MNEFFAMGGYAAYVWPAYALAALVLLGLLAATWKGLRDAETTLKALESARPARRRPRNAGRASLNGSADNSAGSPAEASEG